MRFIAAVLCIAFCSSAHGQTLQQQEQLNQLDKVIGAIEGLKAATENLGREKKRQCMTAIANEGFCQCLTSALPVVTNFVQYVSIVNMTKEEIQYEKLSPEDKRVVDNTRMARDKCVNARR